MSKLQGIIIDTATPFDHAGNLYRTKIEHNIGKWNRTSVAGYVVGGFTGEGATLSAEERIELWTLAAQTAAEGKILIAGLTSQGVSEASMLANRAADAGFAAVLAETPNYDVALLRRGEAQMTFFRGVADRSPIPLIVSNRPRATGIDLSIDILLTLSQHPNICGVVDSSSELSRFQALSAVSRNSFGVFCGAEEILWESLRSGAAGAISPFANAAPYATIALWEAFRTREEEAGIDWQTRIGTPASVVTKECGVPGLKHAMDLNGYFGGPPRLPLCIPSTADKARIEEAFAHLKS